MMPPTNESDTPDQPEGKPDIDATEDFTGMVTQVSTNLTKMQGLLAEEGVPEELTGRLGELNDQYKALLKEISSSVGSKPEPKPPGGMVDANAGRGGKPLPP